jgi:hypothetical protein
VTIAPSALADWISHGGVACPACGKRPLSYAVASIRGGVCQLPASCPHCGAAWIELYELVGLTQLVRPGRPAPSTKPN